MIKTLTQLREGNFFNLVDYLQKKPIANITLNGEILDAFPQEQEQGKDVDSYHSFHQVLDVLEARKRNKRQIRKKKIKLFLFAHVMLSKHKIPWNLPESTEK